MNLAASEYLMACIAAALVIFFSWKIFKKTGYPGWFGVGIIIPVVNFILILVLAFSKWPIEKELEQMKRR